MKPKMNALLVVLFIAVLVAACSPARSKVPQGDAISDLTKEEATATIDSAMQAFNTGDYATWSRDWDSDMKAAIPEAAFQDVRKQVTAQYGKYVALESVEIQPGQKKGYVRWVAIANFEKGQLKFTFGFLNDGRQIKGVFSEPVE